MTDLQIAAQDHVVHAPRRVRGISWRVDHRRTRDGWRWCPRGPLSALLVFAFLFCALPANADIVQKGIACVPGSTKQVNWTVRYRKTPGSATQVHFWFDVELKKPEQGDDIKFVVCAMLSLNTEKKCIKAFKAKLVDSDGDGQSDTWECQPDTSVKCPETCSGGQAPDHICSYPNVHFGCKRVRLHAGNGFKENVFDELATMKVPFLKQHLVAPYLDFAVDCPNGFNNCGDAFQPQNRFLTPGTGLFPQPTDPENDPCTASTGSSSFWIVTAGAIPFPGPIPLLEALFNAGNWYTMTYLDNVYECVLTGTITDAPAGATIEFEFPPSTGAGIVRIPVEGKGCLGEPVDIAIPFTITSLLLEEIDEHIHMRVLFPGEGCPQYPSGEIIEFRGRVVAANDTFFPGGKPLFVAGQWMHGVHVQFIGDHDLPFVEEQEVVAVGRGLYELGVRAADATTMAIGASVVYSIDGGPDVLEAMPFDDPAADGESTLFAVTIGPIAPGSRVDYSILLVDDAQNESSTGPFNFQATPCPWDLDNSGTVGATDLLSLLVNWGPCKGCPADFDDNGSVGATDLLAMLVNWGPCP